MPECAGHARPRSWLRVLPKGLGLVPTRNVNTATATRVQQFTPPTG
jgi:hypothetical protein